MKYFYVNLSLIAKEWKNFTKRKIYTQIRKIKEHLLTAWVRLRLRKMEAKFLDFIAIILCSIAFLEGIQCLDLDRTNMRQDHLFQRQNDVRKLMLREQGSKRLAGSKRYDSNIAVYQPHMGNKRKKTFILLSLYINHDQQKLHFLTPFTVKNTECKKL